MKQKRVLEFKEEFMPSLRHRMSSFIVVMFLLLICQHSVPAQAQNYFWVASNVHGGQCSDPTQFQFPDAFSAAQCRIDIWTSATAAGFAGYRGLRLMSGYPGHSYTFDCINDEGVFPGCAEVVRIGDSCASGKVYSSSDGACVDCQVLGGHPSCPNAVNGGFQCENGVMRGNPINALTGNKFQKEIDYQHSDGSLDVIRYYNSYKGGWGFGLPQLSFYPSEVPGFSAVLLDEIDGRSVWFDNTQGWLSKSYPNYVISEVYDNQSVQIGWDVNRGEAGIYRFDTEGNLVAEYENGLLIATYVTTTSTVTKTNIHGLSIIYSIDALGRITGFTDPDSNPYIYGYDIDGRLTGITYPNSGGSRIYHYEDTNFPNALTGITDANADRFATWAYGSSGRAFSSEHNNGVDNVTIDYTYLDDATDPRATATNPLGKQTTYHFTDIHGVRKVTQVEGHQSNNCAAANKAYTYDTNGFLETKTDWQGNTIRYTRNAKGQELTRIEAENTPEQRTITTDWHATFNVPIKITESDRETAFTYDPNGNQETRVVTEVP